MMHFLDPNIVNEVSGLTWETSSFHLPGNTLLRAYDYTDVEARMAVGTAQEIHKMFSSPVWCRVEFGPSPDGRMPEGVLLRAFNAFDQYRKEITYVTGYADEIRSLHRDGRVSPPIWVWDYTAIGKMHESNAE